MSYQDCNALFDLSSSLFIVLISFNFSLENFFPYLLRMENSWDISVSVRLILYPDCVASE